MDKLLNYLVPRMVSRPEDVVLTHEKNNDVAIYKLRVHSDDLPKIIGKKGRTIKALRQIVRLKSILSGQKAILALEE